MTYSIVIITITIIMYYSVYKVDYRERTAPKIHNSAERILRHKTIYYNIYTIFLLFFAIGL